MKLKYLLTAMAVPALLAACSQDEFESLPDNNGQALLGKVAGKISFDVTNSFSADTRINWGATGSAGVVEGDEMSLFWVGATGDNVENVNGTDIFKSAANAVYERKNGIFESKNIVYVGKHIIVFPVDEKHYTDKKIVVSTNEEQEGDFNKRAIFVSDLIDIATPVEEPEDGKNYAGYGKTITARVSPLTSQLAFNLKFELPDKISEVTVKKVVIKSDKEIFTTEANLANIGAAGNEHVGIVSTGTKSKTLTLKMPKDTKVTKENNTLLAQIAMLPVDLTSISGEEYMIEVVTNYGNVTITKAKSVTRTVNNKVLYQCADDVEQENVDENTPLNFKKEFDLTNKYSTTAGETNAPAEGEEDGRSWGKRILRDVAVKMSEASIENMEVANSEDLIAAYNTYKLLEKTGEVNFVLAPGANPFVFTFEALATMNEAAVKDVKLNFAGTCTGLELKGAFVAIPDFGTKIVDLSNQPVILGENSNNWNIDVKRAKVANQFSEIQVKGKLTLTESGTTGTGEAALSKNIKNIAGEVNVGSNVTMPTGVTYSAENVTVSQTVVNKATTNVSAKTLTLGAVGTIEGNVTIADGARIVVSAGNAGVTFSGDVTLNGSLLQTAGGKINIGANSVVTMGASGALIAEKNEGRIVLNKRNQNVTVNEAGDIEWTYDEEATIFVKKATDAFNHLVISKDIDLSGIAVADGETSLATLEIAKEATVEVTAAEGESGEKVQVGKMIVNEDATLRIPTASKIEANATEGAGDIEVFGTYVQGTTESNWTGNIFMYNVTTGSDTGDGN